MPVRGVRMSWWEPCPREERLEQLALGGVLFVSGFLALFHLDRVGVNGFGNAYYAAGVQSMLTSWQHFFYLAFDPAGFLALDKAPLALWIQALCARVFGFHGLSLLLPQALAGILSVYVLYRLVRRMSGVAAGLIAAFTLAVMPVSVVTQRTNLPDALLILTLLLATWAVVRAVEEGRLRWLLVGAALVGVGFNIKMLQVLLVVPALVVFYLVGSPLPWRERLKYAGLAFLVAAAVSAPWVLAVELTPAEQRPYVGGSMTNSVVELIFVYNGIARLWGEDFSYDVGFPGPLRLFTPKLAGQVSWLLPFVLFGLAAALWRSYRCPDLPAETLRWRRALLLWLCWAIPQVIYFSVSLFYHRYYLAMLAPAVAALTGIAADALWAGWQAGGWQRGWVALALIGGAGAQSLFLSAYSAWGRWLIPAVLGLCVMAAVGLVLPWRLSARRAYAAFLVGIMALHLAPAVWSAIPVFTCANMTLPAAGPQPQPCWPFEIRPFLDRDLVAYLEEHREGARFLAATYELGIAELGILETGEPFMALGGYRGSDPILTMQQFAQLVAEGEVRFFLSLEEETERWPQQEATLAWVDAHCPLSPVASPGVEVRGPCVTQ